MKRLMKGSMGFLATAGIAALFSADASAAFQSLQKFTNTAQATLAGAGSVSLSLAVKKVADNSADTQINWTGVTLPTAWKLADNYIELNSVITASGGGVQTYTDNTAADATPKFSGNLQAGPAGGLVDTTDNTKVLPMAWSVRPTTPGTLTPIDPNAASGTSYQWFYYLDRANQNNPGTPNVDESFVGDGDPFITVQNSNGIHFAQDPKEFGPSASAPISRMYFEANFSTAVTPRTYKTSKLIVESYNQ